MHITDATTSLETIPTVVRVVLWAAIGMSLLMALGVGIALLAGNNGKGATLLRTFSLCFGVAMVAQGGYVLAPFAIGRSWWPWSFWWMLPVALMSIAIAAMPVIGAIRWTRPDGASGWKTIASMGWFTAIGFVVYVAPPIAMWVYRPVPSA